MDIISNQFFNFEAFYCMDLFDDKKRKIPLLMKKGDFSKQGGYYTTLLSLVFSMMEEDEKRPCDKQGGDGSKENTEEHDERETKYRRPSEQDEAKKNDERNT